jgi:tetratricopeptide (TPR) repeat protein
VRARKAAQPPREPVARPQAEERVQERWIDEGELRAEAALAASRASSPTVRPPKQPTARSSSVDPEVAAMIAAEVRDPRRAARLTERLGQAQEALDRERFEEARRIAQPLLRELTNVAAVHEVLGLASYRLGRWKQAATELEAARALHPSVELLPVLADTYRALKRWTEVSQIWSEVREVSPAPDVLAEARIVAAGAAADRGDLKEALRIMGRAVDRPKRVRDHHLRQWYVLGDLHDRAGNPIEAIRFFELVAAHDRDFVDVVERLRALGH